MAKRARVYAAGADLITNAWELISKPRFQHLTLPTIFNAALKSYEKQTKKSLLVDPLISQLQTCNSTIAILAVLRDQVREVD